MKLSEDPRAGAADIARALSTDQALTARILKLANSAFLRREPPRVHRHRGRCHARHEKPCGT